MLPFSINMCKQAVITMSDSFLRVARILHHRMAGIIMGIEIFLPVALYVIFTFSDQVPLSGLVAMGLLWIARWWSTGRLTAYL